MGTVQRTVRSAARRKKDNFQLCFLAITKKNEWGLLLLPLVFQFSYYSFVFILVAMSEERNVALITGITGQDGSYLAELLLEKGYTVSVSFLVGIDTYY